MPARLFNTLACLECASCCHAFWCPHAGLTCGHCWLLQVDVEETRNSYRWYADVPGLTKDNIQVSWPASCSFYN